MADINKLKDKIKSTIYPNGKGAINASDHQAMLLDMADGMAETDTKLTELSEEINGNSIQSLNTTVGVGFSPSQQFPIKLNQGTVKVKLIDDGKVLSVSYANIYFYDAQGNRVAYGTIYKSFTTITLSANVDFFSLYIEREQVVSSGVISFEFQDNTGIDKGIRGELDELHESMEGITNQVLELDEGVQSLNDEVANLSEMTFIQTFNAKAQNDSSLFARFYTTAKGEVMLEINADELTAGYIDRIYVYYLSGETERIVSGLNVSSGSYSVAVKLKEEITQIATYAPNGKVGDYVSLSIGTPLKDEAEKRFAEIDSLVKDVEDVGTKVNHTYLYETSVTNYPIYKNMDFKLQKGGVLVNKGIPLVIASDNTLKDRVNIERNQTYILDSDKSFLVSTSGEIGLIEFDFLINGDAETLYNLKDKVESIVPTKSAEIVLPSKIYAIVGDTLQLFYRGMIKTFNPYQYNILVSCSKGKQYPRYYEFTPSANDIGEYPLTLTIKNDSGVVISQSQTTIVVKNVADSPTQSVNIACFGDSLTTGGVWCKEADRRLSSSDGTPQGLGLANINFVGSMKNNATGYFGQGGWRWSSYVSAGSPAFRFYVENISSIRLDEVYEQGGHEYQIKEINVTNGIGNILCTTDSSANPSTSGILVKKNGNGDAQITYTSRESDARNPLWDVAQSKMTFIPYANEVANGKLDVVFVLLGWNDVHGEAYPYPTMMADCKTFIDTLHSEFPNAKVKLMGLQVCSVNGGMGANYGATGKQYADTYATIQRLMEMNTTYKEFAESAEYSSFVEYVDIASQFDSEYNMPYAETKVNTRSSLTEKRGTNGVHPSDDGYMQIADVVYRNIIANL